MRAIFLVLVSLVATAAGVRAEAPSVESPPPTPPPAAPPPPPATAILKAAVAVEPGQRVVLVADAEAVVDPQATFEVELSARSPDARLVILDAQDDILPATGSRELASGTRLTLAPAAPLVPGSRYAVRLDGTSQRELHDAADRPYTPLTFPVLAAGTPPPPEPKQPARRTKRRR